MQPIMTIIYTIVLEMAYHKIFSVAYFGFGAIIKELLFCLFFAIILASMLPVLVQFIIIIVLVILMIGKSRS